MGTFLGIILILLGLIGFGFVLQSYYDFRFEWIQDVNLHKVLIVWYNKYTIEGDITREHKFLYNI